MERKSVVLLVDESEFFLGIQRQFLRDSCVRIVSLQSIDSVVPHVRQLRPDMIVLDRFAPGYEGMLCCARLKGERATKTIPVILLVAEKDHHEREMALKAGCDGLLTKPLDRNAYLAMGRRFLTDIDRRMRRVLCHASVFFNTVQGSEYGHLVDISVGGVFIESPLAVRVGDRLKLAFSLPGAGDSLIEAEAEIAWVNPAARPVRSSYPPGFGVRFTQIDPSAAACIRAYIEARDEPVTSLSGTAEKTGWKALLPTPAEPDAGLFSSP